MIIIIITDLKSVYSHCKQSRSAPVRWSVLLRFRWKGGRSGARAGDSITLWRNNRYINIFYKLGKNIQTNKTTTKSKWVCMFIIQMSVACLLLNKLRYIKIINVTVRKCNHLSLRCSEEIRVLYVICLDVFLLRVTQYSYTIMNYDLSDCLLSELPVRVRDARINLLNSVRNKSWCKGWELSLGENVNFLH